VRKNTSNQTSVKAKNGNDKRSNGMYVYTH